MRFLVWLCFVLAHTVSAAPISELGGRRVPIDFGVDFVSHDDNKAFLFTKEDNQRLFVVDLARWGREYLEGQAVLPTPGRNITILKSGVIEGWLYIAMTWVERDGFPIQIFGKPVTHVMDPAISWSEIGASFKLSFRPGHDFKMQFDPYSPFVYSAGSALGLIGGLRRLNLQTGQWQFVDIGHLSGDFGLTKKFLVVSETRHDGTPITKSDLIVLGKENLTRVSSHRLTGYSESFVADHDQMYQILPSMDPAKPTREIVTISLPSLDQASVLELPSSGRIGLTRSIGESLLFIDGGTDHQPSIVTLTLFSIKDGSQCEMGQFRSNGELESIDLVQGTDPRLISIEEPGYYRPAQLRAFVIRDLILNPCN
ncbi:MAG: hypothetical protein AB7F86_03335 [Bdellovibrionales bacterium]